MTEITLSAPALLFPALSLLMLAFTNRFLALATLARKLREEHLRNKDGTCQKQIHTLRERLILIRNMQISGLISLLLCVLSMASVVFGFASAATVFFVMALCTMAVALVCGLFEVTISMRALNMVLKDIEG